MKVGQNCLTSGVEWAGLDFEIMSLCLTSGIEWAGLDFEMMSLTVAVGQSHFCQGGLVVDLEPRGHLAAGAGQLVEG